MTKNNEWWKGAVIYQIYPRSFKDSNNDGVGDLNGIIEKLDYVAALGVDAIWVSPVFKSPMKDFGYDVSDYRDIDPLFGTLADAKRLIDETHKRGMKLLFDQVWSHSSDQHAWFIESRSSKTNPKADWYVWVDGEKGTLPNNWLSVFGGPAWTWDETRQQYYLHHFLKEQPALNIWNREVREEVKDTARFWFEMGVDGFRLDVCNTYFYDPEFRDNPKRPEGKPWPFGVPESNPFGSFILENSMNRPENLPWLEELRTVADEYGACYLGEVFGEDPVGTVAQYTSGNRLQQAYTFHLLQASYTKKEIFAVVNEYHERLGDGWVCWATSNHDTPRSISRLNPPPEYESEAAAMLLALGLSLRGSFCIYQGEELGLPQAELAFEDLQDPYDKMLYPNHAGRDGARTPMPWTLEMPNAGFCGSAKPWLPVVKEHIQRNVALQETIVSTLILYQSLLAWRKQNIALMHGGFTWLETGENVLGFMRTHEKQTMYCYFNLSAEPQREGTIALEPYGFSIVAAQ